MEQSILYLYLKTGGGHISGARALAGAVEHMTPRSGPEAVQNHLADALPENSWFFRGFLEDGYRVAVAEQPWLWPMTYEFSRIRPMRSLELAFVNFFCLKNLMKLITEKQITKIVVLHFLLVAPTFKALKKLGLDLPVITVVMDPYTPHPFWFHKRNVPLVVFSERARDMAVEKFKFKEEFVKIHPLMLKEEFAQAVPTGKLKELRNKYGFRQDLPLVLLAGGGDGIPHGQKFLKAAVRMGLKAQIAVVCGKNSRLMAACQRVLHDNPGFDGNLVRIYGFVDFMYDLMNMADVVLTKGGPATVMETLMLRKPLIVVDYIYGQEKGNVDYVVENNLGFFLPKAQEAMEKTREILENPALAQELAQRVDGIHIENGTPRIARHILDYPG